MILSNEADVWTSLGSKLQVLGKNPSSFLKL
jgi:hypothetical protein